MPFCKERRGDAPGKWVWGVKGPPMSMTNGNEKDEDQGNEKENGKWKGSEWDFIGRLRGLNGFCRHIGNGEFCRSANWIRECQKMKINKWDWSSLSHRRPSWTVEQTSG
jgi:hypothetical protein